MRTLLTPILAVAVVFSGCASIIHANDSDKKARVTVTQDKAKKQFRIEVNGEFFTNYIYDTHPRPILYPIEGPGGVKLTRNYSIIKNVPGEAQDHHHHKSLWFGHGEMKTLNIDYIANYWHEKGEKSDSMILREVLQVKSGNVGVLETRNDWTTSRGDTIASDTRKLTFHLLDDGTRMIDYDLIVTASHGDLTFLDTKEGTMAIRTHPNLRLKPVNKQQKNVGKAVNSNGDKGKALWGKHAAWVDYWGTIDGKKVGIAILDHPSNLRHPTTWHARDYGLVAANPFGLSHFDKKKKGAGNYTLKSGKTRSFRYRFIFHKGDVKTGKIEARFAEYAKVKAQPQGKKPETTPKNFSLQAKLDFSDTGVLETFDFTDARAWRLADADG